MPEPAPPDLPVTEDQQSFLLVDDLRAYARHVEQVFEARAIVDLIIPRKATSAPHDTRGIAVATGCDIPPHEPVIGYGDRASSRCERDERGMTGVRVHGRLQDNLERHIEVIGCNHDIA